MNIFKLSYTNKDTAVNDLLAKGVYINTDEGLAYGNGVQAVVEIGQYVTFRPLCKAYRPTKRRRYDRRNIRAVYRMDDKTLSNFASG
jgi:hypothetical protein